MYLLQNHHKKPKLPKIEKRLVQLGPDGEEDIAETSGISSGHLLAPGAPSGHDHEAVALIGPEFSKVEGGEAEDPAGEEDGGEEELVTRFGHQVYRGQHHVDPLSPMIWSELAKCRRWDVC